MTVIIALKEDNELYMGADSALMQATLACSKIEVHNNVIAGFSGSRATILRLLESTPQSIIFDPRIENTDYQIQAMADLRHFFIKTVLIEHWNNDEGAVTFLVSAGKTIVFGSLPKFTISPLADDYYATGAGYQYALGAMEATSTFNLSPTDRIKYALEASERWEPGTIRSPWSITKL